MVKILSHILTIQGYLTPLNPLSVRPSGKVTFGPKGPKPSAGARKKPPVGGLNFLVDNNSFQTKCYQIYVANYG